MAERAVRAAVRVEDWARGPRLVARSDEEVEHLHPCEVAFKVGGELVEEEVEDEDNAVSLDAQNATRSRDLGAGEDEDAGELSIGLGERAVETEVDVRARELDDGGDAAVVEAQVGGQGRGRLNAIVGASVLLDQAFQRVVDAA